MAALPDDIAQITHNRGAEAEAAIFAELESLPWVVRAHEFAVADGAILLEGTSLHAQNYCDKFWELNELVRGGAGEKRPRLVFFDVKSKSSKHADGQVYIATARQRAHVSFFIGVCAGDNSFVELYPNMHVKDTQEDEEEERREVAINISHKSLFPSNAYENLSPCNAAYRMPITYLADALQRIRVAANGGAAYTNPWTCTFVPFWKPVTVQNNDYIKPGEHTQHFTSYKSAMEIVRCVRNARRWNKPLHINVDFVFYQPRLADLKIILEDDQGQLSRQVFIQHKFDGKDRSRHSRLTKVAIARNREDGTLNWYFTPFERFDFLFYQFSYQNRDTGIPTSECFFIPERDIPERFYTTMNPEDSFEDIDSKFRFQLDPAGCWVEKMYEIILQREQPRKGDRPLRDDRYCYYPTAKPLSINARYQTIPPSRIHGWLYDKFYHSVMTHCAQNMSGVLVVLARDHPLGDLAYCAYQWTSQQQEIFLAEGRSPCFIHDLPPNTPLIPVHLFARDREGTSRGPSLSSPEYYRLNQCAHQRLLIFDMHGEEGRHLFCPLLIVPSDDISFTITQQNEHQHNRVIDKKKKFSNRVSALADQLHTGLLVSDYTVASNGPLVYDNHDWSEVWCLFQKFIGVDDFLHPRTHLRHPTDYHVTVSEVHQTTVRTHIRTNSDDLFVSTELVLR